MYLLSNYNYIKKLSDKRTLIWNTYTGSLFVLDENEYYELINFSGDTFNKHLSIYLKSGVLLENKNRNCQIDFITSLRKKIYTEHDEINFRILPTSSCNARCPYCYEKNASSINMNDTIADNVVSFVTKRSKKFKHINIFWFGGEPLLRPNIITRITNKLLDSNSNKEFYFDMTTNGILFDKKMSTLAKNVWHISEVQISLDGTADLYRSTKNYIGIINPFNIILDNISNLIEVGIHVIIRLNVSKNNVTDLISLIHLLYKIFRNNIDVYAYPLFPTKFYNEQIINTIEMTAVMGDILSALKECGYISKVIEFKQPISCSCTSVLPNNFVILPNGNLVKCTSEMDSNYVLGNIIDGLINKERNNLWSSYEIDDLCKECCFLPICQGGCLAPKMCKSLSYRCCLEKYILNGLIDRFYFEEFD